MCHACLSCIYNGIFEVFNSGSILFFLGIGKGIFSCSDNSVHQMLAFKSAIIPSTQFEAYIGRPRVFGFILGIRPVTLAKEKSNNMLAAPGRPYLLLFSESLEVVGSVGSKPDMFSAEELKCDKLCSRSRFWRTFCNPH